MPCLPLKVYSTYVIAFHEDIGSDSFSFLHSHISYPYHNIHQYDPSKTTDQAPSVKETLNPSSAQELEPLAKVMMKIRLLTLATIVILSFIAEKGRQPTGSESSSGGTRKERFSFLNCFDMSYGTLACILKEVIKFCLYYIRAVHVHKVREAATRKALTDNLSRGQTFEEAIKSARQAGNVRARRAYLEAKHIIVPLMTSGWDLFETLYVGGTLVEGMARSFGGFLGAYVGGLIGEGDAGWLGFLLGSQMGGWIGDRIGVMAYDVGNGVHHFIQMINYLPISN